MLELIYLSFLLKTDLGHKTFFLKWHKGGFLFICFSGSLLGPSGAMDNCLILNSDWPQNWQICGFESCLLSVLEELFEQSNGGIVLKKEDTDYISAAH